MYNRNKEKPRSLRPFAWFGWKINAVRNRRIGSFSKDDGNENDKKAIGLKVMLHEMICNDDF